MFAAILTAIAAIGKLGKAVLDFLTLRSYKKAGATEARLEDLQRERQETLEANRARDAVDVDNPDDVRMHSHFRD